jgi:hypothetical protein
MSLTTYAGNKLLDHMIGKTSFTMPDVFLALFKTAPGVGGTGTECAYTGYARIDVAGADFSAASSLASTNANAFTFGTKTAGTDETVGWWATFDASTSGNMLEFGTMTASKLIANGDTPKINAGDLDRTAS